MKKIPIKTHYRSELIDITHLVQKHVDTTNAQNGTITVYCPHTTAAITVNENADPDVQTDLLGYLEKLIPVQSGFKHIEGNSDAHIKSSLCNASQTFIIHNGAIQLGTWQSIFFAEFDGPRDRNVWIHING